jgi:Lrp/AsnC family transcriptional regulator for asnA, asnC and gidA
LKYDSLDVKIVRILQKDGRRPFAEIARELNVPAGVVQARFAKMKKAGLILGSTLIINTLKMGLKYASSIGIEARENEVEEVKRYVEGLKVENALIEAWITSGRYNVSVAVFLENIDEVFKIKHMIKLHPAVVNIDVSLGQDAHLSHEKLDIEKILE